MVFTFAFSETARTPRLAAGRERYAFTLLEILLVLVILAAMIGLGMPAIFNSLKGHRLKVSAERVQTEFMRARVDAMESGRIRMFRYQPETGNFTVAPFLQSSDELENNLAGTSQGIGVSNLVLESAEQEKVNKTLEEGIVFLSNDVETDMRSYTLAQEQGGDLTVSGWSTPILFYPDGTTSNALLYLKNDGGTITSIKLRSLTGVARIVEPELADAGE